MSRTYWPGEDPLGNASAQVAPDDPLPWWTIAAVVGDISRVDVLTAPRPTLYLPFPQADDSNYVLRDWLWRASGDPLTIASSIRAAMREWIRIYPYRGCAAWSKCETFPWRRSEFNLSLFGLFAALALVLAAWEFMA